MSDEKGWWRPLWKFVVHSLVGTAAFIAVAIPAILLNLLIAYLNLVHLSPILIGGLEGAEYLLFFADLALFAWFVIRAAIHAGKEL